MKTSGGPLSAILDDLRRLGHAFADWCSFQMPQSLNPIPLCGLRFPVEAAHPQPDTVPNAQQQVRERSKGKLGGRTQGACLPFQIQVPHHA